MSSAGRKPPGGGRAVTDDEAKLWKHATRALDPVKAKPRVTAVREASANSTGEPLPPRAAPPPRPSHVAATIDCAPSCCASESHCGAACRVRSPQGPPDRLRQSGGGRPHRPAWAAPARRPRRAAHLPLAGARGRPQDRACHHRQGRRATNPPMASATCWASGSAASSNAAYRTGWRSRICAPSC